MAKVGLHEKIPPQPGPGMVLVRHQNGKLYWRNERGTVKKAKLNKTLDENKNLLTVTSPYAAWIMAKLSSFLDHMEPGNSYNKITGKLMKTMKEKRRYDFSLLHGYEMQPKRPFSSLLTGYYDVLVKQHEVIIHIRVKPGIVKRYTQLVTDFYFEAIILYGDMTKENGLRIESEASSLYPFEKTPTVSCKLSVSLPTRKLPWMVLLKVSCQEKNRESVNPRHFGMKVVAVG